MKVTALVTFRGYNIEGLFTSYDEIANHADQDYMNASDSKIWQPGDLKFADLNGDGKIDKGAQTLAAIMVIWLLSAMRKNVIITVSI